jgi:CBS domain-containing protein
MAERDCVKHFMVTNPLCAFLWQPISVVRLAMLGNAYSFLPVETDGSWGLISDEAVARYLRCATSSADTRRRMAISVADAGSEGMVIEAVDVVRPEERIAVVLDRPSDLKPKLVVSERRLVGILTSFDLL